MPLTVRWPLAGIVVTALAVAACDRTEPAATVSPAPAAERPHVLVMVLDACRADRFSAYGFARPTTPELDALAAEPDSTLYLRQLAQAPHTRASTASLFTGVYPFQHGVFNQDDLTPELKDGGRYKGRRVAEAYETLAERFAAGGYRTFATTTNPVIAGQLGYAQGFAEYRDPAKGDERTDPELVDETLEFLAREPKPGFAYLHAAGCHNPIGPERRDADYFARYGAGFDEAALRRRGVDLATTRLKFAIRKGRIKPEPETVAYIETVYESLVRHIDRTVVARLVAGLRERGLYDRTLLVVTSDHGEELLDHGDFTHGRSVWNEVLHVPLVVKFPRGGKPRGLPARVERVTQTIDLYPGLLRRVGLEPAPGIAGHDLFDPAAEDRIAYAQAPGVWSVLEFPHKAIVFEHKSRAALYDLAADPGERHDLAASRPEVVRRLVRLGEGLRKVLPKVGAALPEGEIALDAETIEQLRSLGYIQ